MRLGRWHRALLVRTGRYVGAGIVVLVAAFPLYWVLINALQPADTRFSYPPELFPSEPTAEAFRDVFSETGITKWLLNTTIVSLGATGLTLLFGAWAGYAFARFRSRAISVVAFATLATQMLPLVIIMPPLFIVFLRLDLNDRLEALVLANFIFVLPVVTWMLRAMFEAIPFELEESAMIDGASRFQILLRVTGPLALPGLAAVGAFAFIETWHEFLFARLIIRNTDLFVGSLGLSSFFGFRDTPWSDVMAAAFIFSVPPILLFLLAQKYLVAGLSGGLKG